jgi:16S rRNA (guanine527-N7)-methyltransferase
MTGEETEARLDALAARFGLATRQRAQLALLLTELGQDRRAPTSVRSPTLAVDVHIADSLVALDVGALQGAARIADLGSGAGFPGLPLAVARPDLDVALIESQGRKCRFLEDVIARVGLANTHVLCLRAEECGPEAAGQDVVLARALAPQPVVLEYAAPLLGLGRTLIDWRGRRDAQEEEAALLAATELGLELVEIRRVSPFAGARDHHLHLFHKVAQTPPGFPRRPGMARKRPLAGAARRPAARRPSAAGLDR